MIDRLATRGLVSKCADVDDGRGVDVALTDAGYDLFRRVAGVHSAAITKRFGDALSETELDALTELCDKLRLAE